MVDFMDGVLAGVLDTDDVVEGEDTGDVDAVEPDAGPTLEPLAPRYGGHQFGNWAGQLGDGRAMSLGEVVTSSGSRLELQLKAVQVKRLSF